MVHKITCRKLCSGSKSNSEKNWERATRNVQDYLKRRTLSASDNRKVRHLHELYRNVFPSGALVRFICPGPILYPSRVLSGLPALSIASRRCCISTFPEFFLSYLAKVSFHCLMVPHNAVNSSSPSLPEKSTSDMVTIERTISGLKPLNGKAEKSQIISSVRWFSCVDGTLVNGLAQIVISSGAHVYCH